MNPQSELVSAIDALLKFVQEHQEIKIDELPEFRELDTRVYVLAVQAGIQRELPDQAELFQLYDKDMPESAVYEGKCNLPGDWWPKNAFDPNRVFMTVPTGRWLDAMLSFRSLASTLPSSPANPVPPKKRTGGRPRKGESDADTRVIAALARHHKYQSGGSVGNHTPAVVRKLAADKDAGVTVSAISRFLNKQFSTGHKGYIAVCNRKEIGTRLALWQRESIERLASLRGDESAEPDEDE